MLTSRFFSGRVSHIQALYSVDVLLLGSSSELRLLVIDLALVPGGQLIKSPTVQSLERCT